MSEPRYQTRVSDPDETTRIPRDALDELRDADQARDASASGTTSTGPSTGSTPAAAPGRLPDGRLPDGRLPEGRTSDGRPGPESRGPGPAGASTPGPRNGSGPASGSSPAVRPTGFPSDGAPAMPSPDGRPSPFLSGASGDPTYRPTGIGDGAPARSTAGVPGPVSGAVNGAATGYRRSETGYSPAAYPNSYGTSAYSSLGDAPTTVTGHGATAAGVGLGTGAAASTAAARASLGAATAGRPPSSRPGSPRPSRRARLLVRHIDPWSTLKFSFVLSVAMFFVWLVAVGVLYGVLDGMGVFEQINGLYDEVSGSGGDSLFSPGLVLGTAALIGVVNIVLFTALATIGAFVYNICSDLVGGIEVTLAERD